MAHSKEERGLTDEVLSVPSLEGKGNYCIERHQNLFHCRIA